ncbi:MAG TPA: serine hydrolase domain-containing protein [Devosia sp.]|jgi:CubicO group peptidase (beta-lactamase class C family)|uniref:serine hydrolase domain-containing protein n=1 Tax=Devosia sp. TaxID=1871048 RepID=UPI002DDCE569|nr:serine hydrolase domain-containing protein [Devosia sp.]HEV2517399.1 serine hydrolase domain-containing protein [Devosia sp.]
MNLSGRLDAAATRAIEEGRIVGSAIIIRRHGELVYEAAHGLADRENRRPMALDTIFRLSSLTKPIVAATILALIEDGKLGLDAAVTDYLPDFRPRLADGTEPTITIRHLLTHTSGLSNASIRTAAETAAGVNRWRLGDDDIIARVGALPLLFAPGAGWTYGPSIDVLGHIAAGLVAGRLEDAIRHYVTGPLGMIDTGFTVRDPSRLAAAYADGPKGAELMGPIHTIPNPWGSTTTYDPERIFDAAAFQSGGGGAAGSGPDFMQLLEALRTGGSILKPETARLALANQTPQLSQAVAPGWQFCLLGAWLDDPATAGVPAPRGMVRWGGIYGHNWFIDPAAGLSVVSMSNTGLEGSDGRYRDDVLHAVYGHPSA